MDKIKTRIIIAVTNKLSAAEDTDARTELIEELSENLYQRYEDLIEEGVAETEAFTQAMENLGDVNELLAYLADTAGGSREGTDADDGPADNGQDDSNDNEDSTGSGWSRESFNHLGKELGKELGELMRKSVVSARDTAQCARDMARDMQWDFSFSANEKKADCVCERFFGQEVQAIKIKLIDGDVVIHIAEDENQDIALSGEIEKLESSVTQDGTLYIRQGNTASSFFLFNRGWGSSDIELTLPRRLWAGIRIETSSGDICCKDFLEAEKMAVSSASGDIEIRGRVKDARLSTASGDIEYKGDLEEAVCTSASGDIHVESKSLPAALKLDTKSGDCNIRIPDEEGFTLNYRTISGDLSSDIPLMVKKVGKAVYKDGGSREYQVFSVSGDIFIKKW